MPYKGLVIASCLLSAVGCSVSETYQRTADRITHATMAQNDSWHKMEELCDGIGHRLSGSPGLENAVAWAVETLTKDGHENVRAEKVIVPHWVRGAESAVMIEPHTLSLAMLGLGGSVGTPPDGLTAPIVVVRDEIELANLGEGVKGKIVLFNNPMPAYDPKKGAGYGTTVRFRGKGAVLTAKQGGIACLIRSVTAKSFRSPHTGAMRYEDGVAKIPAAAISTEDADIIARLRARGQKVVVSLRMEARTLPDAESANVVAELRGREKPEEIVVIGGHLDSWDVGQGAHDDAAGCVMSMEALNVLRKLDLRPRRTIRVVLWTNEENGLAGGKQYAKDHAAELPRHVAAIESDSGGFNPDAYSVECADKFREKIAAAQVKQIARLLNGLGVRKVSVGHSGADVSPMKDAGVMLMGFSTEGSRYFDYHHSPADTLDKVDPTELSRCVASMAVMAYVLADMPQRLGE
jgi:carboxypeptidase Q